MISELGARMALCSMLPGPDRSRIRFALRRYATKKRQEPATAALSEFFIQMPLRVQARRWPILDGSIQRLSRDSWQRCAEPPLLLRPARSLVDAQDPESVGQSVDACSLLQIDLSLRCTVRDTALNVHCLSLVLPAECGCSVQLVRMRCGYGDPHGLS